MTKNNIYILYSALIMTYVLNVFLDVQIVHYVSGILAILALLFSFREAKRLFQVIGSVFLIVGVSLFIYTGTSLLELPYLMTSTVSLLALLYVLPFINSIIVVGRYDQNINKLLKDRVQHLGLLYYRSLITTYILGFFLNFATIPLVHAVLQKNLKNKAKTIRNMFISRTVLRGFALCLVWCPMEIMLVITIDITQVGYLTYLPWLLLFSISLLVLDSFMGWRFRKYSLVENEVQSTEEESGITKPDASQGVGGAVFRKIGILLASLVLFVICILTVSELLQLDFLMAVTLVIIPYSFIWALLIKRFGVFLFYSFRTWKARTNAMQNFVVLFISLGFCITILRETSFLQYVQEPFIYLADTPILVLLVIQGMFLVLALLGIHPLATIGVLGEVIQPLLGQINPLSVGIVLITASLATITVGPYGMTVTMVGYLSNQNPYRITWWNMLFALIYGGLGTLMAVLLL